MSPKDKTIPLDQRVRVLRKGHGGKTDRFSLFLFGVVLLAAILSLLFFSRQLRARADLHREHALLLEQKDNEVARSKDLNRRRKNMKSDEAVADIARQKLGMLQDGEKIFVDGDRSGR